MEKQGLKSGYLLAQNFIFKGLENAFHIKVDTASVNVLLNDKKGDYQTAFGNMVFNKFKESNEDVKKLESPLKFMQHMKTVLDGLKDESFEPVEVNDKAFMFLKFSRAYLESVAKQIVQEGLFVSNPHGAQKIAIDFSSPNVAKEMHVGHLRSTIMGESICRIMEYMGNTVHRINHIGDWGTQFGMLISHMFDTYPDYLDKTPELKDLETFYIAAKKRFDEDPEFKKRSQETVVKLQSGDPQCLKAWNVICDISRGFFTKLYKRLEITNNEYGESYYNPMIPDVIKELETNGHIKVDKGAKCFFIPGKDVPLMVQKTDGGYGYDTTDLAASKYRLQKLGVDRVIILTDVGQFPHFDLIFRGSFIAGWAVEGKHRLDHMGFGLIQNDKGGKMATREGGNIKLMELLDEAKARAKDQIVERLKENAQGEDKVETATSTTKLTEAEMDEAAEVMGIDAVKYFDLNQNRIQNYKFSYEKMLSPKGNTAVYLLYSYARINSIIEKSGIEVDKLKNAANVKITDDYETVILAHVAKFCEVILGVADELNLNRLCAYLYEFSGIIASGYKKYKILGNEHTLHRVQILYVARMVFDQCFFLLGLKPLKKI
jgi:arginyl-tRNA synthetase